MAVDNYVDLQAAIATWMNRSDLVQSIPDFITLAESEFNRTIRDTRMMATAMVACGAGGRAIPLPADFLQANYVTGTDSRPLEQWDLQQLTRMRRTRLTQQGTPIAFAINGRSMELCPTPNASGTIEIEYFQQIPPLATATSGTNWLLTFAPDLYLKTAMKYARIYLQDYSALQAMAPEDQASVEQLDKQASEATLTVDRVAGYSLTSPSDGGRPTTPVATSS